MQAGIAVRSAILIEYGGKSEQSIVSSSKVHPIQNGSRNKGRTMPRALRDHGRSGALKKSEWQSPQFLDLCPFIAEYDEPLDVKVIF
jgi:hypothetical protein